VLTVASLRLDPDPVLRGGTEPLELPVSPDAQTALRRVGAEMLEVMRLCNGVGLAGPQVGLGVRLFVLEAEGRVEIVCNPEIVERHEPYHPVEGCLSVPGVLYAPRRHRRVRAIWTSPDGTRHDETFAGLLAEIFEHEVDHLDGRLLYDLPQGVLTDEP
jgi:peptide deformylase